MAQGLHNLHERDLSTGNCNNLIKKFGTSVNIFEPKKDEWLPWFIKNQSLIVCSSMLLPGQRPKMKVKGPLHERFAAALTAKSCGHC